MTEREGEEERPSNTEHIRSGEDQTYRQPPSIDEPGVEYDDERHIDQHDSNSIQKTLEDENWSKCAEEGGCN